jgi:opacity protein-like surface antigen
MEPGPAPGSISRSGAKETDTIRVHGEAFRAAQACYKNMSRDRPPWGVREKADLMRRTLLAGAASALALVAAGAAAQTVSTPSQDAPDSLSGEARDWAGYAHVGYHLDPHWRVEMQGGYRAGATSPASIAPGLCADPLAGLACGSGERALGAYSAVANLVFDALPDNRWISPFVGIGAGLDRFDQNPIALGGPSMGLGPIMGGARFGYQALVGLAFRPFDRLHLDLTYRWLGDLGSVPGGPLAFLGDRFQDQTVAISVRYALSSPRAAIAPAPLFALASSEQAGPATPRTVVVETPSDPAELSAEAEAAVGQAALSAGEGRDSRIVVDGHADTTSAADYNRRLFERRAKAMADAVVALGVPASSVDVRWSGDGADPATTPPLEASEAPQPVR